MKLAFDAGLYVAPTQLVQANGRDVLLVERFDRESGGRRKMLVSALTILSEMPMTGHYATYPRLADEIRARFTDPTATRSFFEGSSSTWSSAISTITPGIMLLSIDF